MDVHYFYPNVKRICKEQRKPLGEVEMEVGVSPGYFSRTRKKSVSVSTLVNTAKILDVSVDILLSEPAPQTNADKFVEVFGFLPGYVENGKRIYYPSLHTDWWEEEYKEPEKEE